MWCNLLRLRVKIPRKATTPSCKTPVGTGCELRATQAVEFDIRCWLRVEPLHMLTQTAAENSLGFAVRIVNLDFIRPRFSNNLHRLTLGFSQCRRRDPPSVAFARRASNSESIYGSFQFLTRILARHPARRCLGCHPLVNTLPQLRFTIPCSSIWYFQIHGAHGDVRVGIQRYLVGDER